MNITVFHHRCYHLKKNVIRRSGGSTAETRLSDSKKRKSQQLLAFQHLMLNTLIGRMALSSTTPDQVIYVVCVNIVIEEILIAKLNNRHLTTR